MRFSELADSAYPITFDNNSQPIPRTQDAQMSILDAFIGGLLDRSTAHMCLNFGKPTDFTQAIDFVTEFDANNAKLDIILSYHRSQHSYSSTDRLDSLGQY